MFHSEYFVVVVVVDDDDDDVFINYLTLIISVSLMKFRTQTTEI